MFFNRAPIILASGSPRRREYLQNLGLDFSTTVPEIDETVQAGESPNAFVERMAKEKGLTVCRTDPGAWVISGDTVVCIDDRILGKPSSEAEALALLLTLRGRQHVVISGFCVANGGRDIAVVKSVETRVDFADFSEELAKSYVATGEPFDKAGAYGIQGKGAVLVAGVEGSYSNVVGLPLHELTETLLQLSIITPQIS